MINIIMKPVLSFIKLIVTMESIVIFYRDNDHDITRITISYCVGKRAAFP